MSMGMFMLPPAMISLPFKLLLFVLVDGWTLSIQSARHRASELTDVARSRRRSRAQRDHDRAAHRRADARRRAAVGLVVSVLQAVTQIQEQTLVVRSEADRRRRMFLVALPGSSSSW